MTRINTNVNSLVAQTRLTRTNNDLQTALTRLSTGLRINTGKDDPAGLIASEALRSDITSINKSLSNTQRANQVIATADSALGQVSSLLNDIRGLVTEAANAGALSPDEIAANQLQIDSSLEAINRIAQTTTFQGRKLLDGSLDFLTKGGTGFSTVKDLQIDQANLGATGSVAVDISISAAATQATVSTETIADGVGAVSSASITFNDSVAGAEAAGVITLANSKVSSTEASGTVKFANSYVPTAAAVASNNLTGGMNLTATVKTTSSLYGEIGNSVKLSITTSNAITDSTATFDANTNVLAITLKQGDAQAAVLTDLNGLGASVTDHFNFTSSSVGQSVAAGDGFSLASGKFISGANTVKADSGFKLTAVNGGAADGEIGNNTKVIFTAKAGSTAASDTAASYDAGTNTLTVLVGKNATVQNIVDKINSDTGTVFLASDVASSATASASAIWSSLDNDSDGSNASITGNALTGGGSITAAASFKIKAKDGGAADGAKGNSTIVKFQSGATNAAAYNAATNELTFTVAANATITDITNTLTGNADFELASGYTTTNGSAKFNITSDAGPFTDKLSGGTDTSSAKDVLKVFSSTAGASLNTKTIQFIRTAPANLNGQNALAAWNGNVLEVKVSNTGNTSLNDIKNAIDGVDGLDATVTSTGGDGLFNSTDTIPAVATLSGGANPAGINADLVFQLTGTTGSEVVQFQKGATLTSIIQRINQSTDATGVTAVADTGKLKLTSVAYGSKALVAVDIISEGAGSSILGTANSANVTSKRSNGTDVKATVNGIGATGDGNTLSVNTATLNLKLTVNDGSSTAVKFDITGGGAVFQLGPDVVSNQQARLGIGSLNTARLGGISGRLFELGGGQARSLTSDITGASKIVDQVIDKVTTLRGRLGAFQRTTLDSNTASLTDTLSNLTEAQSSIRDADFAKESANLTRAQILVQSGTQVLQLANQNPQNVLSLLR